MTIDSLNYKYRKDLASELRKLKIALDKCGVNKKSIGSIDRAIKKLEDKNYLPPTNVDHTGKAKATSKSWGYDVHSFVLKVDLNGTLQYPKAIKDGKVAFSISVSGEYFNQEEEHNDPFKFLEINIVVEGKSRKTKEHVLSYHLDRHQEGKNPSKAAHPIYHFQMGGRKLNSYTAAGKNFGNKLILDGPRFMHYPMDFILGLDFVISNFEPSLWEKLKREKIYLKLLKKSQERVLKPYFASMACYFGFKVENNNWLTQTIFPQLV